LLACTWTSTKFDHRAPPAHVLIRAFVGGTRHPELVNQDDAALIDLVKSELKALMGINSRPVISRVYRWQNANPQYDVGHLAHVDQLESLCPAGLYLTGSAYRGVGIPDCIAQAHTTAQKTGEYLKGL